MENTINLQNETIDLNELDFLVPVNNTDSELELSLIEDVDDFILIIEEETDSNTEWLTNKIKERESKSSIPVTTSDTNEGTAQ